MKGKYVVFEGPDGSGKTSLAKRLVASLQRVGQPVQHLAFPSRESAVGGLIRDTFEGRVTVSPEAMMWLFVAEGKDREPQIRRMIADGTWIVVDRHTMISGLVYQREVHGAHHVDQVTQPANFTVPDRIYLVDVPAHVALARREARGEARNALYEPDKLDRLDAMCETYRGLRERFACSRILDGTVSFDANLRWMWKDLELQGEPPS